MAVVDGRAAIGATVDAGAADWEAAIEAACRPLVDAGAVEPRYVRRCVGMVEDEGPYMVLAPGIALAHARPEDGVNRLGLAVATLAEPVAFGHPDNDPVDVVFAFGSPDRDEHVGLLRSLARRLQAGLGDQLRAAESEAEATALLDEVARDAS